MAGNTLAHKPVVIDTKAIQKASIIYRAINHSLRLQIIEIIHKAKRINVAPIIEQLRLEQSVVSSHLKVLRDTKIVNSERKGSTIFYSINYQQLNRILTLAEKLTPYRLNVSELGQKPERKVVLATKNETISFTPTELKIIRLVCEENTSEEIAEQLGIPRRTVEGHKSNIIRKMKVKNSVGILFFAIKNKIFAI